MRRFADATQELQRFKPACESKREAQLDVLAQGARNRLEKAEEKLQSAMTKANRCAGMAIEWVQEIAGDEVPH
ncbi:hypothetical protein IPC367_28305 [Pseudomonas aeruginosa]|uniref:hypothetical protein n=1 Tax=Pseudomonas aeruginosa TaxID=287 RepID=UPI000AB089AB|nr:hypothetical protein [Pseudomonas aeruginosa]AZM81393.1 hypothetical protein EIP87_04975 [Pseudomonas aeruginosa]EIU1320592.1 hypothetical protein [Pseudomonas aeruginosa]MBH9179277.1 hypothetical protein [Pseudomonas aeruginosa]MBN0028318.1 hypothetical protein [Pseudomonas aeruginosa]MBN0069764.1 hypothetical protein [Pseudomonas aeruginosa]